MAVDSFYSFCNHQMPRRSLLVQATGAAFAFALLTTSAAAQAASTVKFVTSEGDFVASESVKNRIREIIEKEDSKKPLSDQKIADMLSVQTVNIARRTVTKYREILKLGSSSERKRHF